MAGFWTGIGQAVAGLFTSVVSSLVDWWQRRKLSREASRGRAAGEYLKSEDAARKDEERQKEHLEKLKEDGTELDPDDVFNLDTDKE